MLSLLVRNSINKSICVSQSSVYMLRRFESSRGHEDSAAQKKEFYDIVICGGGMVGSAMAYALGKFQFFLNFVLFFHLKNQIARQGRVVSQFANRLDRVIASV